MSNVNRSGERCSDVSALAALARAAGGAEVEDRDMSFANVSAVRTSGEAGAWLTRFTGLLSDVTGKAFKAVTMLSSRLLFERTALAASVRACVADA